MLRKMLDRLLALHFQKASTNNRLDRLEQDVWRRIHTVSAEIVMPWYDKMVMAFTVPQFRAASLAIALVIGISVSPVFTTTTAIVSNQDVLGMDVFAIQSPYLPSTLIGHMK